MSRKCRHQYPKSLGFDWPTLTHWYQCRQCGTKGTRGHWIKVISWRYPTNSEASDE